MRCMRPWDIWWRSLGNEKKKACLGAFLFNLHQYNLACREFFFHPGNFFQADRPSAAFIRCHTSLAEFHRRSCSFCLVWGFFFSEAWFQFLKFSSFKNINIFLPLLSGWIYLYCFSSRLINLKQALSADVVSRTLHLMLPALFLNMVRKAIIFPRANAVTFSITSSLQRQLPGVCDHTAGRANPIMTSSIDCSLISI